MNKKELEKRIETFVYGILSLMFGMAFFFGVLYPGYGVSPQSYRITECRQSLENGEKRGDSYWEEIKRLDHSEIHYKSYFYERLKNS